MLEKLKLLTTFLEFTARTKQYSYFNESSEEIQFQFIKNKLYSATRQIFKGPIASRHQITQMGTSVLGYEEDILSGAKKSWVII